MVTATAPALTMEDTIGWILAIVIAVMVDIGLQLYYDPDPFKTFSGCSRHL